MASPTHSFISPTSAPRRLQSAKQLADESHATLLNLESTLKQRNEALELFIQRQEQEKAREKNDLEQKLQNARQDFADKREELWSVIDKDKKTLVRKNQQVEQLKRTLNASQRNYEEARLRAEAMEQENQEIRITLANTRSQFELEMTETKTKQKQLRQCLEQKETQLREKSKAFERERTQWQHQTTDNNDRNGSTASLEWAMPHLRGLLDAYDHEQGRTNVNPRHVRASPALASIVNATIDLTQTDDVTPRLAEQQHTFDREREQLLEQASDAARTQHDVSVHNLTEREGILTCPISLELFDDPVVVKCCGKTFSSSALGQALRRNSRCPLCRATRVSFYPNRDVAKLIELHRAERSVLGLPELPVPSSTTAADGGGTGGEWTPHTAAGRIRQSRSSSRGRQSRHQEQRNERVLTRSNVPHRQHVSSSVRTMAAAGTSGSYPLSQRRSVFSRSALNSTPTAETSESHLEQSRPYAVASHATRAVAGSTSRTAAPQALSFFFNLPRSEEEQNHTSQAGAHAGIRRYLNSRPSGVILDGNSQTVASRDFGIRAALDAASQPVASSLALLAVPSGSLLATPSAPQDATTTRAPGQHFASFFEPSYVRSRSQFFRDTHHLQRELRTEGAATTIHGQPSDTSHPSSERRGTLESDAESDSSFNSDTVAGASPSSTSGSSTSSSTASSSSSD